MAILTVQPSAKDNFLYKFVPDTNRGTDTYLYMYDLHTHLARPVLEFDIPELSAGATLVSAYLQLYYYNYAVNDPVGRTVWAYKLSRTDWVELQSTWNIYKTGSNWTAPGGDYVTSNPSGGSIVMPSGYGWVSWNVLDIVQDAYDGSIPAEFLVRYADEAPGSYSAVRFYSKEYTDDITLRPKLIINYQLADGDLIGIGVIRKS